MRSPSIPLIAVLAGLISGLGSVSGATPYFEDNFDGAEYNDNAPLVIRPGARSCGIWHTNLVGKGSATTLTEQFLSPGRSLALGTKEGTGNSVQAVGYFSDDGINRSNPTTALTLRFAFRTSIFEDAPMNECYVASLAGHQVAVVYFGGKGEVISHSQNKKHVVADTLQSETWYYLELKMPELPGHEYTVNVYEQDGTTLIGTSTAGLRSLDAADYHFFTVHHSGSNFTTCIDNVSAVSEP